MEAFSGKGYLQREGWQNLFGRSGKVSFGRPGAEFPHRRVKKNLDYCTTLWYSKIKRRVSGPVKMPIRENEKVKALEGALDGSRREEAQGESLR
jgi:hypothetical protein